MCFLSAVGEKCPLLYSGLESKIKSGCLTVNKTLPRVYLQVKMTIFLPVDCSPSYLDGRGQREKEV